MGKPITEKDREIVRKNLLGHIHDIRHGKRGTSDWEYNFIGDIERRARSKRPPQFTDKQIDIIIEIYDRVAL